MNKEINEENILSGEIDPDKIRDGEVTIEKIKVNVVTDKLFSGETEGDD